MSQRLCCPFCESFDVSRLYLASLDLDACACAECGVRWDERAKDGEFVGRGTRASVISPRPQ